MTRPVYFQAVKGASPVKYVFYCLFVSVSVISDNVDPLPRSAVDFFSVAFIVAPFAMVAGGSISATQIYRPQNIIAWSKPMNHSPSLLCLLMGYYSSSDSWTWIDVSHTCHVTNESMGSSVRLFVLFYARMLI